jgi:AcrR family transcriptional regulator
MAGETAAKRPLPRGRHSLSEDEVRASQRERLVTAMLASVGEIGYTATNVPDVVARARVSRNAFYALFDDKADCFIEACDEHAGEMLETLLGRAAEPTWRQALSKGMVDYLSFWQERPAFTRAYFVELPAAGARAVAQRDRVYGRFREMFNAMAARARAEERGLPPLPPLATRLLVLGMTELIGEESRAGRVDRLGELHDDLVAHVEAVLTCA